METKRNVVVTGQRLIWEYDFTDHTIKRAPSFSQTPGTILKECCKSSEEVEIRMLSDITQTYSRELADKLLRTVKGGNSYVFVDENGGIIKKVYEVNVRSPFLI